MVTLSPPYPPFETDENTCTDPGERDFLRRANKARTCFGLWDYCDPVAEAILALVEAQNLVAAAISAECVNTPGNDAEIGPAFRARAIAAGQLTDAILKDEHEIDAMAR